MLFFRLACLSKGFGFDHVILNSLSRTLINKKGKKITSFQEEEEEEN